MKKRLIITAVLVSLIAGIASAATVFDFKIINRSGFTILTLHIAAAGSDEFSDDFLNEYVLQNNYQYQVNFDEDNADLLFALGVDLYDIMFVDEDGDEWIIRNVRLETVNEITITFSGGTMRYTAK